jgi:hypothetical protein
MAVVTEGIRAREDGTIDFGNYLLADKLKINDFPQNGSLYRLRTHKAMTRLEKEGNLLLESVPGAAFFGFSVNERAVSFSAEGDDNTQITVELEPEQTYSLKVADSDLGCVKSTMSGKITFSLDLTDEAKSVRLEKTEE